MGMNDANVKDGWNAELYDGKHAFISQYGNDLIQLLAPKQGEKILDLGCGTGDLAQQLFEMGVHVIGIDKSENMISEANKKYPHIEFSVGDATSLEFDQPFDAIFSNAVLHWIKQPKQALDSIYQHLKTGGRFVAEFGGKGNVKHIRDAISDEFDRLNIDFDENQFPWFFPSIGEYTFLMESVGFKVEFAYHFDRPTVLETDNGMQNWIEMFCGSIFESISETVKEQIITGAVDKLRETQYQNSAWIADYKRIRVIGIKE